ncbi:MAG: M4 family metallopeptidase, partial [Psychrosphaera sp.]|nr:M4 family metallopeptidase [Psychrosphaera sp.]
MNCYSKLMLAASLSLTPGVSLAAEVESYFNNATALSQYNRAVSKAAISVGAKLNPTLLAAQIAQHFAAKASGNLKLIKNTTQGGQQFFRYQQTYKGLNIWDQQLILRLDDKGIIKQGYGSLVNAIAKDLPNIPQVNEIEQRQQLAVFIKKQFSDRQRVFRNKSAETVIYLDGNDTARVAYKFNFFTDVVEGKSQPQKILAFVDVNNGEILEQKDVLDRAIKGGSGPSGNAKAQRDNYNSTTWSNNTSPDAPNMTFAVNRYFSKCYFDRENVATHDTKGQVTENPNVFDYSCSSSNGYYTDEDDVNTAKSAINDAHYNGQLTSRMFESYLGQKPFLSQKIHQNVHYGNGMDQAFYNEGQVYYGDGDYIFFPMVALDVVAHEIAHGFTEEYGSQNPSNKKYMSSGQAGAINESFSDIAGAAAEFFLSGGATTPADMTNYWRSNSESYQVGDALRYFDNPSLDEVSIDHTDNYETSTPLHYAAGIFNKAFYNLITADVGNNEDNPWTIKYGF